MGIQPRFERWELCAQYGIADLLCLIIRPNKKQITRDVYNAKIKRWTALWPKLTVVEWNESQVIF